MTQSENSAKAQSSTPYRRLLRDRNFMALWIGQTISFIGDYFNWLAIPILVERLTGSTLMVGLSVISSALPMLVLGPVAGVFVDRWDRRRTMIVADVLRGLLVLLCLVVQSPEQVWVYYVVGFLMSCVSRFFFPAQNAALPLLVPDKDDLLVANGMMQIVQTVGMLAGPALAGFAIGLWGEWVAFIVDSTTFFASAVAILTMTLPRTTSGRQTAPGSAGNTALARITAVWAEMREGVAYLFGNQTMVGVLICLVVVQLALGAINVVWVPFLQRTFGVGAEGLGIVDAAQGVGMVAGGVALGFLTARLSKVVLIGWMLIAIGLALSGMGLSPHFIFVVALGFAIGLALVPAQSALMTIMQLAVPDLKRGRVGSALNALTTAAGLVSMAAAATLGETIGLRTIYIISGFIVAGAGALGFWVLTEPELPAEDPLADPSPKTQQASV
jgi:DHA3 family macrolide efflux protein-like MFS transporter